jgi:hypothetical protein
MFVVAFTILQLRYRIHLDGDQPLGAVPPPPRDAKLGRRNYE